jgi:hypothetical protein
LTNQPMSEDLVRELAEWQSLGSNAWNEFPFEDSPT